MGSRSYALHVASLLDPKSIYFGSRIISRENCTTKGQKGLDVVPVDESGILILDDTKSVWSRNLSNLIVIEKYRYFRPLSEEGKDESESAGSLSEENESAGSLSEESESAGSLSEESESARSLSCARSLICALKLLQEVHDLYFGRDNMLDVRVLLTMCKIANDKCIQHRGLQNLQCQKKLCLVLDLDHTLVDTKLVCELSPEKAKNCLDNVAEHKDDIFRWKTTEFDALIKLRPFVRKFLEEANKLFEMYIYTMRPRGYALHVASLLDPKSIYFGSRIISGEDCTTNGQKGLDVVPVDESGILVLDDTKRVWSRNLSNLIVIEKYRYFRSLSEEGMDESESAGSLSEESESAGSLSEERESAGSLSEESETGSLSEESESARSLSCALKLLQEVHNLYFGRDNMLDVRVLLSSIVCEFYGCQRLRMQKRKRDLEDEAEKIEWKNSKTIHTVTLSPVHTLT